MKVLYIATYSGLSGATHSLIALINQMRKKGIVPLVVIPTNGPIEQLLLDNNIPYKKIRLFNWVIDKDYTLSLKDKLKWSIKYMLNYIQEFRIKYLIKKENIKLVHINAITAHWGARSAYNLNVPLIWHIREFLEEDLNKSFRNPNKSIELINKSSKIIAISNSVEEKYKKVLDSKKLLTIYNGVDVEKYKVESREIMNKNTIQITLIGRIAENKGHHVVIKALDELKKRGVHNLRVKFIGSYVDEQYLNKIKCMIERSNLTSTIEIQNYKDDILSVWMSTDIAIVSSTAEAFGRVTVEAMMAKTLVIGADSGGTKEIISDNKHGLLYKNGDYLDLADKIHYAINNKNEMINIINAGFIHSIKTFTSEKNAENIYEIYKDSVNIK